MLTFNARKISLGHELDKVKILHVGHLFLAAVALLVETSSGFQELKFSLLTKILLLLLLYNLSFKTIRRYLYTFWSFAAIAFAYFFISFIEHIGVNGITFCLNLYLLAMVLLFIECYLFSSPIFFPRVRWWEYDFRYRADLPIKIIHGEKDFVGRLTDLRRGAGCMVSFNEFDIADKVLINVDSFSGPMELSAEIVSQREPIIGRGFTYGVKFVFDSPGQRKRHEQFARFWRMHKKARLRSKFSGNGKA